MKFGSVCSGIEAASVAWHPIGWEAAWLSEIEKFPSQVLAHHYPNTPNFGDMTKFKEWPDAAINVLVGGTPCQSFSVAGLRKGLDDPRGNLMLTYLAIAAKYRPKWLVWENVPGVLSSNGGLDFASLLRGMGELGYGFAYRVLDAQYFGVAQRRRRVFVVGYLGNWRPAAAVLFERHSLCGYPAPSREKRESAASTITTRTGVSRNNYEECVSTFSTPAIGSIREDILASCITKNTGGGGETQNPAFVLQPIAYVLSDGSDRGLHVNKAEVATCLDTSNAANEFREQSQNAATLVAQSIAYSTKLHNTSSNQSGKFYEEYTTSLDRSSPPPAVIAPAMAFPWQSALDPIGNPTDLSGTLVKNQTMAVAVPIGLDEEQNAMIDAFGTLKARTAGGGFEGSVMQPNMQVRRLTPMECERLQGFPDGYTDIQPKGKATPDGPRYKALGNSMAVPVMAWIGQRIQQVEDILG